MRSPIPGSIIVILFIGALFWCNQGIVTASALTAITDVGKDLARAILSHPMNTITSMTRGINSGYGMRSMVGYSPLPFRRESVLPAEEAEDQFKREQKVRDQIVEKFRKKKDHKTKLARKSIPEFTDFVVYWRGVYKSGFWFYRMYMARNAKKKLTKGKFTQIKKKKLDQHFRA